LAAGAALLAPAADAAAGAASFFAAAFGATGSSLSLSSAANGFDIVPFKIPVQSRWWGEEGTRKPWLQLASPKKSCHVPSFFSTSSTSRPVVAHSSG
jgi:hypothetical protein